LKKLKGFVDEEKKIESNEKLRKGKEEVDR
jgi:hypothetical protein